WRPGSRYECMHPLAPSALFEGENLEVDPPRRLGQSFRALFSEDVKREGTTRVTWEIEPVGDSCRLTLTHDQLREDANIGIYGGRRGVASAPQTLRGAGEGRPPR